MARVYAKKVNAILSLLMITAMLFGTAVPAQAVEVGNDTINFIGYRYDYPEPGESTWYYEVTSGAAPAISHVNFALNLDCLQVVDAGTWDGLDQNNLTPGGGNPQIGTDPTTQVTGLKFDQGFNEGETRYYYFTVDNNYALDMITIASKGGNGFDPALIEGPSSTCEYYPPNPTPAIDIEKNINGQDVDSAPGLAVTEGDLLTFDFIVTNTGNVGLVDVVVDDNVFGFICTIGSLGAGEIATCSIPVNATTGSHVNIGAVQGVFPGNGQTVSDSDPANYTGAPLFVPAPAIDIEKFVLGDDADQAPGVEVLEGATISFEFVVTNTGNVPLTNIIVTDSVFGHICDLGELAPAATQSCTFDSVAVLGLHTNLGTVSGSYDGTAVTDSDPANYTGAPRFIANPIIDIEKYINGEDADTAPGVALTEGDPVAFRFDVTNLGNVALTNVVVVDDVLGDVCAFDFLSIGETVTCTANGTAGIGEHVNVGSVTGSYNGSSVSDSDAGYYTAVPLFIANPAIDLEKLINGQDVDSAPGLLLVEGTELTFDFIVTNTGNVDLVDIRVTDDVFGEICMLSGLAAGATSTCSLGGLAAVAGQHTNIGTAAGSYNQTTVSDTDAGNYFAKSKPAPKPGLKIKKYVNGKDANEAPGITVAVGSTVTFTYMVGNSGTVTLTNIIVADNILGQICTIASLAPGQTVTCTATSTAIAGQYMNIGKAATWYGDPKNGGVKVTASDPAYYFGQ